MGQEESSHKDKPVELQNVPVGGQVWNVPDDLHAVGYLFLKVREGELRYLTGHRKGEMLTEQLPSLLVWPVRSAEEESVPK